MSDDLIKQLHNVRLEGLQELCWKAADRIKELEHEKKEAWLNELDALAKLAKAVEIGNEMAASIKGNYYIPNVVAEWNAVLAELEKNK